MLDFYLYRIKVHLPSQAPLFEEQKGPSEILREVVLSLPSAELRKDLIWHIGNVKALDETGLYFRVGRTTRSRIEVYQQGSFLDQEFETAPYTHVLLDAELEVCAIAKKTKLTPAAIGIGRQLVKLLQEAEINKTFHAVFEVGQINDPEDFIAYLRKAYSISKFWVTFTRPNPFDINQDFLKPFSKLLDESDGEKGKTELIGQNLSAATLEELARSAAATGDDAGALLRSETSSKRTKRQLKGNAAVVPWEDISDNSEKQKLLHKVRDMYHRIRGKGDKE